MITRVRRILRQRLLIIVLTVLAGVAGAFLLTRYLNDQIRPTFEGTATVYLDSEGSGGGGRASAPDLSLSEAEEAAIEANQDFLDLNHGIRANPSTSSIHFIVSARNEEEAATEASDMRIRYLVATAPAPIEQRISDVLQKAHFVREELDGLLPPELVPETDPADVTQYSILSEQIRSLNTESAKLAVELVLADSESEKAAIQADLDLILGQIVDLRNQLEALPPEVAESAVRGGDTASEGDRTDVPEVAPSDVDLEDQFRIESLQSLYATLLTEFQTLYIQSIDAAPQNLPEVEVSDETPDPVPPVIGAGIGFAVTLLLMVGGILVIDRLRPRWWTQQELASPLAEVPDRRCDEETWYWQNGPSPRKQALQRSAVRLLPTVESGPAAVGLIGPGVSPISMRRLGYDLGAVLVTSGRRTLVVDATGLESDEKSAAAPPAMRGLTVGEMLNPWQKEANGDRAMEAVTRATTLWPGLYAIASGPKSLYSVEGAMTPAFGRLIRHARDAFALTIVPVADRGGALTEAFARNLDAVVVVGRGGETRLREAERLLETFQSMGKPVLGTLLIVRPPRRSLRQWISALLHRKAETSAPSPQAFVANGSSGSSPNTVLAPLGPNGAGEGHTGEMVVGASNPPYGPPRGRRAKGANGGARSEDNNPATLPAGTEAIAEAVPTDEAPSAAL
ncbi:MAG TPA: hypothetical protein VJ815_02990 [Acidimicrobiia bacterium]|nr:hypothetical protein [Acidimicrobiia bacterium]